jgi:hypothetical protein
MRNARARVAAVLLPLALVAAGCDLVSSLTPFGIGHKDYSVSTEGVNGDWAGKTNNGGDFTFQVASDRVLNIVFKHIGADCNQPFTLDAKTVPVVDGVFIYENVFAEQGQVRVEGHFTSDTTCTGTYSFEGLPASRCLNLTAGNGTFAATKKL